MKNKVLLPMKVFPYQCPEAMKTLKDAGFVTVENTYKLPFDLHNFQADFDDIVGVICGSEPWSAEMMDLLPNLRVLSRFGVGIDNIDIQAATARNIVCKNTPGSNSVSVAEHCVALILECMRYVGEYNISVRNGKWEKNAGYELSGKTLGIIGFGAIARKLCDLLIGFEVKIIAYDPYIPSEILKKHNAMPCELDELLRHSDIVSLHLPATEETRHLISKRELILMKKQAILINTARGSLVDSDALFEALRKGWIRYAASDVFETEPPNLNHPIFGMNNFVVTPHIGGGTEEANRRTGDQAVMNLLSALEKVSE